MRKLLTVACAVALLGTVCRLGLAQDSSQSADAMLAEIRALKPSPIDQSKKDDPEYRKQRGEEIKALMLKKAEMARQFYDRFPDHASAPEMMESRWMNLSRAGQTAAVEAETKAIITEKPASTVATSARFARAMIAMQGHDSGFEQQMILVEDFIKAAPQDKRGGDLLMQLASYGTEDQARQTELLRRVQTDYPGSKAATRAGGKLRQTEGVGKPFELAFTEAITGKPVSMSHLKGKVIVVDFWATWCGPCVAEMPHMKELYGQWKSKGVEFIGVSLDAPEDKGGLDDLKKFVSEHKIEWPQYYQGKGWESEFSSSWGIDSIPALFVVDADGNLFSTKARGKLEEMVPELIAKRDGKRAQAR